MKQLYLLLFMLTGFISHASAQAQLTFQYDAAGNQIVRQWVCVGCTNGIASIPAAQQAELEKSPLFKDADTDSGSRTLTGYPNPVSETLQVKWWSDENIYVRSIEVFSLNGTKVFQDNYTKEQNYTTISFISLAPGAYLLRAIYSDGKKEILKIIKQ